MPEPGWYDDPQDPKGLRWWDGTGWTERRQPRDAILPPPTNPAYGIPLGEPTGGASGTGGSSGATGGWDAPPPPPPTGSPSGGGASFGGTFAGGESSMSTWPASAAAPSRTFGEAIQVCLQKYVVFSGRASRSEYWYFSLFTFLVQLGALMVSDALANLLTVAFLLPSLSVSVRRLHDIGKSAWNLLWGLFIVVGWIVLLVYAVRPGDPNTNAYG
jgi:uncharacterized membrane protein YhaH (DUF805 family)